MAFKKNKYLKHFISLIILASCSTISKDINVNSVKSSDTGPKDFQEIFDYQSFSFSDLEKIQKIIDSDYLNQEQSRDAKLLKKNYKKILSKKNYSLKLNPNQKYSKELIKLIYQINLPVQILWDEKTQSSLPENLFIDKINGFCSSLYDDALTSINKILVQSSGSILVIYSREYISFIKNLKSNNSNLISVEYDSSNFQEFSAQVLGIYSSEKRFKNISSLNPNQNINFIPRPRSDLNQVVIFLNPQEYKSMIPALRYHGGSHFKYINFISSLEDIGSSMQLMDYEDSWNPISKYLTTKIKKDELESLEKFLELGALHEWFSIQLLKQAGVKSAKINGITGSILYQSNACTKRDIPMQKISSDLISS